MRDTSSSTWRWLAPAIPLAVLAWGLATAPARPPAGDGDARQRARAALQVRHREPALRRRALEKFPGDPWSQGDDFANGERQLVRALASPQGMRPGAVLQAIDADVKAHPMRAHPQSGFTRGQVPPCMPRVFYF